jgi:hypothetical protein
VLHSIFRSTSHHFILQRRTITFTLIALGLLFPLATSFALSDLQPLPDIPSITQNCADAYNANITSCTDDDIGNGSTCSSACVSDLNIIARNITSACTGIMVEFSSTESILAHTIDGAMRAGELLYLYVEWVVELTNVQLYVRIKPPQQHQ